MNGQDALASQRELIAALAKSLGDTCTLHETHISWVLVAGRFAWKFKKAVRFDFLDFSTLEQRRFFCEEEVRLNRRFAPGIYLDVVPVTGSTAQPVMGGAGQAIEYAVRMQAFDQNALWSRRAQQGLLTGTEIDRFALRLAQFHERAEVSPAESPWCLPSALQKIADDTLDTIIALLPPGQARRDTEMLQDWEWQQRELLHDAFMQRKASGRIRECHGDLHCGNVLTLDDSVGAFDCIEFNESLRRIDVMNDIAFTCMDLRSRGLGHFAARLLNGYLEACGDHEGLRVFHYYEVHRALIRCKVAMLRAAQEAVPAAAEQSRAEAMRYLSFAKARRERRRPIILITHGFSGSGKSTLARFAVEALDAIQLRSDVERKRSYGVSPQQRGTDDMYAQDVTERVYVHLRELARTVVEAGWPVIVDATFLMRAQRQAFFSLARELDVAFAILDARAEIAEMRRRISRRIRQDNDASDAGEAILERQLACHEPFSDEEIPYVIEIDTAAGSALDELREKLAAIPS
ncbi:MAG TPA: AAA family ATPase [Noviherbaspirillum sp.]|nr:AAA family ATPase [Noviherbaspirillum sp.]